MTITWRQAVGPLRLFLVALFGVLVVLEVMSLPGQWAHMAEENPEHAGLRWPLTAVSIFWVLCTQVVVVCIWRLLSLVRDDRIFTEASLKWVDAIVWAIGAAWVGTAGRLPGGRLQRGRPGSPAAAVPDRRRRRRARAAVVVMRALLRQATTLRTDMESVI